MRSSVDLHNYLQSCEIAHEIYLAERQSKPAEMADALGLSRSDIGMTVILLADEAYVMAVVSGDCCIDMGKIKEITGVEEVREATAEEIFKTTGYLAETVPPVGHVEAMSTLVDHRLMDRQLIYSNGGDMSAVLKIRPADLVKACGGRVADIANDLT